MNESKPAQDCDPNIDASDTQPSGASQPLILTSEELFRGRSEVWIEHGEGMYRLRRTGANKLYLSK